MKRVIILFLLGISSLSLFGQEDVLRIFAKAIKESNAQLVECCLRKGVNPNVEIGYPLEPAILLAVQYNHSSEIVELLQFFGADLNIQSEKTGETALMKAVLKDKKSMMKWLLQRNVNRSLQNKIGMTALMIAAHKSFIVAQSIVTPGIDFEQEDQYGQTALSHVIKSGHTHLVEFFLKQGANPSHQSLYDGKTPLMHAVNTGSYSITRMIIDAGADVKAKDHEGYTAFKYAALHNNFNIMQYLVVENDANIHVQNNVAESAIALAQDATVDHVGVDLADPLKHMKIVH